MPSRHKSPVGWRVAVPLACACAGLLATTSMINARGTDLRGGRHSDLTGIVADQSARVKELRAEAAAVQTDIDALTKQVGDPLLDTIERRVGRLDGPTGLTPLSGPGLVVTLTDAPLDQDVPDNIDDNLLVVHQQDLQAVMNALWAGGAEAMTLMDQRVISTSAFQCVGNVLKLHGRVYSPPYVVRAIGNPDDLRKALNASPAVQIYLRDAAEVGLGWSVTDADQPLELGAYSGTTELGSATVPDGVEILPGLEAAEAAQRASTGPTTPPGPEDRQ
jgi:uncharacterized protein YlxW (UPF0749 family)